MNLSFSLNLPTDLAIIFGILGSLVTFFKGMIEYTKQGSEKRANRFFKLEHEFFSHESFKTIVNMLDTDNPELAAISYEEKVTFLGFLEQIALLVNSTLLTIYVANYVYGYYVNKCAESKYFWTDDLDKDSPYWKLFFNFAEQVKGINPEQINPNKLRF